MPSSMGDLLTAIVAALGGMMCILVAIRLERNLYERRHPHEQRLCALCLQPMKQAAWWLLDPLPFHDPDGPDGIVCQRKFKARFQ